MFICQYKVKLLCDAKTLLRDDPFSIQASKLMWSNTIDSSKGLRIMD